MVSSNSHTNKRDNGKSKAFLFEAISHDTRIRILSLLRDHNLGFSELRNQLEIKSSGNLQHHLRKLGTLVNLNEDGLYALTANGREAIMAIRAVHRTQNRQKSERIIVALIIAFSFYIGFINGPFLLGTINKQIPVFALWMAIFMSIIMYLTWPWIYRQSQKENLSDRTEDSLPEASLYDSIAHEARISALFLLHESPLGYSELKKQLELSSSGNLQHHIDKLGVLIEQNEEGLYSLTDNGREAVIAIQAIRDMQEQFKRDLNAMIVIGTLIFYIVQLTVPFLLGTVDSLTPINALISSVAFGICFYIIWSAAFRVIAGQTTVSSIEIKDV